MSVPPELLNLMKNFEDNLEEHLHPSFNEDSTKNQFIDPLFELLGWDVNNKKGATEAWRDVLRQHSIPVGAAREAPDYIFKIGNTEVFVVEAKKPSLELNADPQLALQARSYGWNRKLPLAILTNFREFAVYDCRQRPKKNDKPAAARLFYFLFKDYPAQWDDILSNFTREAVEVGKLDKLIEKRRVKKGTLEVDEAFLQEIEEWRKVLASNTAQRNNLNEKEINYAVQMTIDRIVFLRICEDRGMESPGQLLALTNAGRIYPRLFKLFENADERYNSGLFHFREEKNRATEPDRLTLKLEIDDDKLKSIIKSLYDNFYDFSLIPVEILGQIYEKFLGNVIYLTESRQVKVKPKPEVRKAKGVFYTPSFIVDYIVDNTVGKLLEGKSPAQVSKINIVDPACGSGSFLLGAYQKLLNWHLEYYASNSPERHQREIYPVIGGGYRLTTAEKKRILLNNIFGVDIDSQAVEVTKLSLLLKVLEGETEESLRRAKLIFKERALPDLGNNIKCGNSLIGSDFYQNHQENFFEDEERYRINVFDWETGFPGVFKGNDPGFDAVIGNPPYVRIQTMRRLIPQEFEYLKKHYLSASKGNYDIYVVFVERGLNLINENGRLSFILPSKFFSTDYGEGLRTLITANKALNQVVDFGYEQVFSNATTYTCLLFLTGASSHSVEYLRPTSPADLGSEVPNIHTIPSKYFTEMPWDFGTKNERSLAEKLVSNSVPLRDLPVEISRGSSSGLDNVFILRKKGKKLFTRQGKPVDIEKAMVRVPLYATNIGRYKISPQSEEVIIFPYDVTDQGYQLKSELEIKNRFPNTYQYLLSRKRELQRRKQFKSWFGFSAPRNLHWHDRAQILVPLLANRGLCCQLPEDSKGYCLMASGGFSITISPGIKHYPSYVLGLLNSKLLFWRLRSISNKFRGGWITCTKQYVETLPIHLIKYSNVSEKTHHDRIVKLVDRVIELHKSLDDTWLDYERTAIKRQIEATDRQIDELVYELYGLTQEEIALVEGKT